MHGAPPRLHATARDPRHAIAAGPAPVARRVQRQPGLRAAAGGLLRRPARHRLDLPHRHPVDAAGPARPADRAAAARLGGAHRRQRHRLAAARHAGRHGVSEGDPARAAAAVAGLGLGRLAARPARLAPSRRQRRDPWPDVPGVRTRPAAPRPRGDRRRHARLHVLWRHADDHPAARGRGVLGVAPRWRTGRRDRCLPVPPQRSAAAAPQVQLGDRGRTAREQAALERDIYEQRAPQDVPVLWKRDGADGERGRVLSFPPRRGG